MFCRASRCPEARRGHARLLEAALPGGGARRGGLLSGSARRGNWAGGVAGASRGRRASGEGRPTPRVRHRNVRPVRSPAFADDLVRRWQEGRRYRFRMWVMVGRSRDGRKIAAQEWTRAACVDAGNADADATADANADASASRNRPSDRKARRARQDVGWTTHDRSRASNAKRVMENRR